MRIRKLKDGVLWMAAANDEEVSEVVINAGTWNKRFSPKEEIQPTIDPVKHGKWEMGGGYPFPEWTCSRCNIIFCGSEEYVKKCNYCPNCGARMDVPDNDVGKSEGEEDER